MRLHQDHRRGRRGKTLLCRRFLSTLDDRFVSAYIPNPFLEPKALMHALAEELGVAVTGDLDQHQVLKRLNQALLEFAAAGRRVVVCLDEAQAMPLDTLEALRLLSNLETEKSKLLQVVLFVQSELDDKIARVSAPAAPAHHVRVSPGRATRDEVLLYLAHPCVCRIRRQAAVHPTCGGCPVAASGGLRAGVISRRHCCWYTARETKCWRVTCAAVECRLPGGSRLASGSCWRLSCWAGLPPGGGCGEPDQPCPEGPEKRNAQVKPMRCQRRSRLLRAVEARLPAYGWVVLALILALIAAGCGGCRPVPQ